LHRPRPFPETPVKLTNLKITPKLGILVGVTLLGLCAAGLLAGYLMQREMLNACIETKSDCDSTSFSVEGITPWSYNSVSWMKGS